jgi:hypothetical protein
MGVVMLVHDVAMAMEPGRRRIQVDARGLQLGHHSLALACARTRGIRLTVRRVVGTRSAGRLALEPGPHRQASAAVRHSRYASTQRVY